MDLMPNVHFDKDELIFEEGYPADSVYLVCDGEVQVFKKRNNEQVCLATLGKDSIFGEMAFISNKPRSATVMSSDDTWCYSLNKDAFLHKLNNADPLIIDIFNDLVETINKKNSAAVIIDHGTIFNEPLDELSTLEANRLGANNTMGIIAPKYSYDYLTGDPKVRTKVEDMDFFMRKLYNSLVKIACNN